MVTRSAQVILTGLMVPEGPTLLPDGRLAFTQQTRGAVSLFDGTEHHLLALTGGAPNAAISGAGDVLYVTQNGGTVGTWRSRDPQTPSIQRVTLDGRVSTVVTRIAGLDLVTPNDLVFGPDGRLYFTDPAQPFDLDARQPTGKIFAFGHTSAEVVRDVGAVYCNGLAFTPSGRLLWVESYTRKVWELNLADREARMLCELPVGQVPDGIAVAEDGRIFVATCASHGITMVAPDGTYLGMIPLDDGAFASNLCFDGASLWVTDFGEDFETKEAAGRLWRVETDAVGLALHAGGLGETI